VPNARYSSPYLRDGKGAAVRCTDRSKYQALADIDRPGVRIVVNPGETNAEYDAANIHQATIVKYQLCAVGLDHPFTFEQKAYLIPEGSPALQQWADQWLNIAQNDGTYAHISQKWLGVVGQP
jgi:cyclohexadienyl dehydratase